jgi:hypothetical protein
VRQNAEERPDQTLERHSGGRAIHPSHLGFHLVQKTPIIHASLGFIWGIPVYEY